MSHETHCCVLHGCKYGDSDCPVVARRARQVYACEMCEDNPLPKVQHELKLDPDQFDAVLRDAKRHEVRSTLDRTFQVGDLLILQEYNRDTRCYTGRELRRRVTNITAGGTYGLPEHLCVMSLGE